MWVDVAPNRGSPPAILLREGWREGNKIRKRTLANLSSCCTDSHYSGGRFSNSSGGRRASFLILFCFCRKEFHVTGAWMNGRRRTYPALYTRAVLELFRFPASLAAI